MVTVAREFGSSPPPIENDDTDINHDEVVDEFDIVVIVNFGQVIKSVQTTPPSKYMAPGETIIKIVAEQMENNIDRLQQT